MKQNNDESFRQLSPEQRTAVLSELRTLAGRLVRDDMQRCAVAWRDISAAKSRYGLAAVSGQRNSMRLPFGEVV